MLRTRYWIATSACLLTAGVLVAQDGPALTGFQEPLPAPAPYNEPIPYSQPAQLPPVYAETPDAGTIMAPIDGQPMLLPETGCDLFQAVVYRHPKKAHPCSIPAVIAVKNPCLTKRDCPTSYVNVEICLPPCDCAKVKVKKCESKVVYMYGGYSVEVTSKKGKVIVTYHRHPIRGLISAL